MHLCSEIKGPALQGRRRLGLAKFGEFFYIIEYSRIAGIFNYVYTDTSRLFIRQGIKLRY